MLNRAALVHPIRNRVCLAAMLAVIPVCGCGGGSQRVELAPVSGIVLYEGKPVEGAVVEFVQDKSPTRSMGFTDASGQFELTSFAPGDGAPVGLNKVSVSKRIKPAQSAAEEPAIVPLETISDPEERRLASNKNNIEQKAAADRRISAEGGSRPRDLLPTKYARPETSGLEFTVEASGENDFQIVLTD